MIEPNMKLTLSCSPVAFCNLLRPHLGLTILHLKIVANSRKTVT